MTQCKASSHDVDNKNGDDDDSYKDFEDDALTIDMDEDDNDNNYIDWLWWL